MENHPPHLDALLVLLLLLRAVIGRCCGRGLDHWSRPLGYCNIAMVWSIWYDSYVELPEAKNDVVQKYSRGGTLRHVDNLPM